MAVVIPPSRRRFAARLIRPLLAVLAIIAIVYFLCHRFGETAIERAERLYLKRDFPALLKHTRRQIDGGDRSPLFFSHNAVATFALEPRTTVAALMERVAAADQRPIFRRETLLRIAEINALPARTGEILFAALKIEKPPGAEVKAMIADILKSSLPLSGTDPVFGELQSLFPRQMRSVTAKRLQLRSGPSTEAIVIRQLQEGEILLIRNASTTNHVSGRSGKWTLVLDKNMESGWVFDAYLSPLE